MESSMWMQALLLTPYIAIASSLVLTVTVALICYQAPRVRAAGFAA
jgi:hypothetical protein